MSEPNGRPREPHTNFALLKPEDKFPRTRIHATGIGAPEWEWHFASDTATLIVHDAAGSGNVVAVTINLAAVGQLVTGILRAREVTAALAKDMPTE